MDDNILYENINFTVICWNVKIPYGTVRQMNTKATPLI
jgi:hypothetical protein